MRFPYKRIVLYGIRGSGKSTIGSYLASSIGWQWIDLDEHFYQFIGTTLEDIVQRGGWSLFEVYEKKMVVSIVPLQSLVFSAGGRTLMSYSNASMLCEDALMVHLWAPVEVLVERLNKDPKISLRPPVIPGGWQKEIEVLSKERWPRYSKLADLEINTGDVEMSNIVSRIMVALEN